MATESEINPVNDDENTDNVGENTLLTFESRIDTIIEKINNKIKEEKAMVSDLKGIKKEYLKEKKVMEKATKKSSKSNNGPKRPGGFSIPQRITTELSTFLNLEEDVMICRTDVTRMITTYVRDNNILGPDSKRDLNIWDDSEAAVKLRHLLQPVGGYSTDTDKRKITWFNLQHFMARHYPKGDKTAEISLPEAETEIPPPPPPTPVLVENVAEKPTAPEPAKKVTKTSKAVKTTKPVTSEVPEETSTEPVNKPTEPTKTTKTAVTKVAKKIIPVKKGGVVRTKVVRRKVGASS